MPLDRGSPSASDQLQGTMWFCHLDVLYLRPAPSITTAAIHSKFPTTSLIYWPVAQIHHFPSPLTSPCAPPTGAPVFVASFQRFHALPPNGRQRLMFRVRTNRYLDLTLHSFNFKIYCDIHITSL